jgi:hypothetical protein
MSAEDCGGFQCDMKIGKIMGDSRSYVTPPKSFSRSLGWPKAPATIRSALSACALDCSVSRTTVAEHHRSGPRQPRRHAA